MKNIAYCIALLWLITLSALAQEFKYTPKSAKKIKITSIAGRVSVETHSGREIIMSGESQSRGRDDDNDDNDGGMRVVTPSGASDNTGIGLSVSEEEGFVIIKGVSKRYETNNYKILVPEKMNLHIISKGWWGKDIKVKNFREELEIKSEYGSVFLDNVTGPVVCNVVYNNVKVVFDRVNQSKPISIVSTYNKVDITLPDNTPANLKMQADYGNVYSDMTIQLEKNDDSDDDSDWKFGKNIVGKLNGGGVEIYLRANYGNVYLRKRK